MAYQYYPNNQFYMQDLQNMKDRIESQIKNLQQQNQVQQPFQQPITQNFQLAPNPNNNELEGKYANSIDDVKNTFVMKTGIFVDKDFSTLWIKDVTGNIRTFETEEIVEIDEKDKEIQELKKELEKMKGMIANANKYDDADVDEQATKTKSTRVQSSKRSNTK